MDKTTQVLDVAEQLVNEQGILSFRFSDIPKAAGCSNSYLYKHYANKEEVIVALFNRNLGRMVSFLRRVCYSNLLSCKQKLLVMCYTEWLLEQLDVNYNTCNFIALNQFVTCKVNDAVKAQSYAYLQELVGMRKSTISTAYFLGEFQPEVTPDEISQRLNIAIIKYRGLTAMQLSDHFWGEALDLSPPTVFKKLCGSICSLPWRDDDAIDYDLLQHALSAIYLEAQAAG